MAEDMSMEEFGDESVNFDDEESELYLINKRRNRFNPKSQAAIDEFLGNPSRIFKTGRLPGYYRELLTWALHQCINRNNWEIVATIGYRESEPVFKDVNTGEETCYLLVDGQLLIKKENDRYALTVDIAKRSSIQIEGPEKKKEEMKQFIDDVLDIAKKENFYRGKKIEYNGMIRFLDVKDKSWESIVLIQTT